MATTPDWIYPLRKAGGEPDARLLVFPYAAAGASSLRPLLTGLPARIELLGVSLPGRERRFGEPPSTDHEQIVAEVVADLARRDRRTTYLFGHSMGASLALALAVAAPDLVDGVVISAREPTGTALEAILGLTDDQIVEFLGAAGGTAPKLLADDFWRRRLLDLYRSDVRLDDTTSRAVQRHRLRQHLVVLGGADDPWVAPGRLAGWAARTTGRCGVRVLPGEHFYLLDPANFPAIVDTLDTAIVAPALART